MDNFGDWLMGELDRRDWKQADLARASGLDSAVISNLINGRRNPGQDTCTAIAKGLGYPVETVFRGAGILPKLTSSNGRKEVIFGLVDKFPEKDYRQLVAYLEMLIRLEEEEQRKPSLE